MASEEAAVEQAARSVAGVEMKLGHAKAQAEAEFMRALLIDAVLIVESHAFSEWWSPETCGDSAAYLDFELDG